MSYDELSMGIKPLKALSLFPLYFLIACGESNDTGSEQLVDSATLPPVNSISFASFRDIDSRVNQVGGAISLQIDQTNSEAISENTFLRLYWADEGERIAAEPFDVNGVAFNTTEMQEVLLPELGKTPDGANTFLLYLVNETGESQNAISLRFHDFTGNVLLAGPGGNEEESWYYGEDRAKIAIHRTNTNSPICIFDNGLVSVIDMANTRDEVLHTGGLDGMANQADDLTYPPYSFQCDVNPVNNFREISDEHGVWTFSTLNDAMSYGTAVYDTFLKHLGEPPLADKVRIRVHYASLGSMYAFWDGAYANFSDAYPFFYSMASLDAIAHEVAHGVINRISDMDFYDRPLSVDARTVHEAFADISGVMAKYEFYGEGDHWIHDEGIYGYSRSLDKIVTESRAIASYLDYDDAGENFYLRIGMMTYPFYLFADKWGIDEAYQVYIGAARHCWFAEMSLPQAAACIKQEAISRKHSASDVDAAFKTVKIKLFEDGVLSHFTYQTESHLVKFTDNSQSTSAVQEWFWEFGDGNTSTEVNPAHTFQEPGVYIVTLKVIDASGDQDSIEKKVIISE